MSCYANLFIRLNDEFVPVGDFSRNSRLFGYFESMGASYEKIVGISIADCESMMDSIKDDIKEEEDYIARRKQEMELVAKIDRPIDEILEVINECQNAINAANEEISELRYALHYIEIIKEQSESVRDEIAYQNRYPEEYPNPLESVGEYLYYVGIEIGRPTIDDIAG
jgi:DNA repair ATPase RecN